MRYHLKPIKTSDYNKQTDNNKYQQGHGETETLIQGWEEGKIVPVLWKTV
jgi:hypothetical protein